MKVLGLIAEYNPFHYGHAYHLQRIREISGIDAIVCAMSGNYVQRGEPAVFDKWARAEMALGQGVDLVIELPVLYATHSAYWFARGGIETLYKTGIVTHLTFGIETSNPDFLDETAKLLASEPLEYRVAIKSALKEGLSFPKARAKALSKLLSVPEILDTPNNVLGVSYLQVLHERNIPLIPLPITRKGTAYNDKILKPAILPSATAVRKLLAAGAAGYNTLAEYIPAQALAVILREINQGRGPILPDSLNVPLMTLLRKSACSELLNIVDVSEGLENRIARIAQSTVNYKDFLDTLKTKRFTYTRLQRFLIHLLLNYTKEKEQCLTEGPPYLRILGFTAKGRILLNKIAAQTDIPLIIKAAHAVRTAESDCIFNTFWEMDTLATDLYALLYPAVSERTGRQDYYRKPVSLP